MVFLMIKWLVFIILKTGINQILAYIKEELKRAEFWSKLMAGERSGPLSHHTPPLQTGSVLIQQQFSETLRPSRALYTWGQRLFTYRCSEKSQSLVSRAQVGIKVSSCGPESARKYMKTFLLDKMEDHGQGRRRPEETLQVKTERESPERQVQIACVHLTRKKRRPTSNSLSCS